MHDLLATEIPEVYGDSDAVNRHIPASYVDAVGLSLVRVKVPAGQSPDDRTLADRPLADDENLRLVEALLIFLDAVQVGPDLGRFLWPRKNLGRDRKAVAI